MKQLRFRANGLILNCLDYGGEGKPSMLFVHGGSALAHWWDFVAPPFTDDFHVLAIDLRGHGDSEWTKEWAYGSRHYLSDLQQVIDQWSFGAPIMIGHSMGAHNVMVFATRHSDKLSAMVAIDSPADYTQAGVDYLRAYAERAPRSYASLEEAISNFKVLPRETLATKEILEHVARHSYRQLEDGRWTHKLDRRTLAREPMTAWDRLADIRCPGLYVKVK